MESRIQEFEIEDEKAIIPGLEGGDIGYLVKLKTKNINKYDKRDSLYLEWREGELVEIPKE